MGYTNIHFTNRSAIELNLNELHTRARGGDKAAEDELFRILSERFRIFVHHRIWSAEDGEEIVQEALMTVAREYCQTEIRVSFAAWAHQVLQNRILAYIKAKKGRESLIARSAVEYDEPAWNPDPESKRRLIDCLRKVYKVNVRYARVLNLHYLGFSRHDICRKLDLTANAYYVLLSRARDGLRDCLNRSGGAP
jgi:RNA polymerase sigma factor (sigma-70 family)